MHRLLARVVIASVLTILLLVPAGNAEGSTSASTTPVSASDCTAAPRAIDELRTLTLKGLPRVTASLQGTPVSTPVTSESTAADGEPADERTFNAAQEIVRQIAACSNAGNLAALVSLYDDEGAAAYLAVGYWSFARATAGDVPLDDPALLDLYLASLQLSAPLPDEDRVVAYQVDSVTVQEDGLIYVVASFARGQHEPSPYAFYLREDQDRYRIVFDVREDSKAKATSVATAQP